MSDILHYDVVVIGAGPAGYVAAIRCSQLGLNTACVDKWFDDKGNHHPGGTCLNAGCIPSKALLESSEHYHLLNQELQDHGIHVEKVRLDIGQMMAHKEQVVSKLTRGISQLLKANQVSLYQGHACLMAENKIKITHPANETAQWLQAENVILAPGSESMQIPVAEIDHAFIVDSSDALAFSEVPRSLGIIGAGVIGLELGSVWSRLGAEVTLLEAQDQFLTMADENISKLALSQFKKSGLKVMLGARVTETNVIKKGKKQHVSVRYQKNNQDEELTVDKLLVAVGRVPLSDQLISPEVDLLFDENGFIDVDKHCRTNLPNIYAIGDAVRGPMLAHKGSEEGMAVAETIAGNPVTINLELIPSVIYTLPEIAWVGKTENMLITQGIEYKSGVFPFAANGRAVAVHNSVGQVKILSDAATDQILGVHIIGPSASELIAQAVIAMEFQGSAEDLARTTFAHPTLSEAVHEAALACDKRAIHMINR